jgi:hypothetical protein
MCGGTLGNLLNIGTLGVSSKLLGGLVQQLPGLPPSADPADAARKTKAEDVKRRQRVAAGGRSSTLLAGGKIAQETQQRKTLLGQ